MRRGRTTTILALCFLLPNLLGFLVFTLGPVLFSLVASFSSWNLAKTVPFRWVGLASYAELLQSGPFWLYFANTVYLMLGIPVGIAGSLLLALLLSRRMKGLVVYRTLFYLPSFTAGVALMILWKALYNPHYGPINAAISQVLDWVNAPDVQVPMWLSSTKNLLGLGVERLEIASKQLGLGARDAIILMGIWTVIGGNNMLLYIAGISNIPPELQEAAEIDGAGAWGRFRHVIWPQLAPTTFFILIMSFIGGLQGGFEQARVMTNGGPAGTTTTLSYFIYTKAFEEFRIGYASAVSWALFVIIFALTLVHWRYGSRHADA